MAVTVAMLGAAMFGFDQGNFGNVQSFESFRQEWCLGRVFAWCSYTWKIMESGSDPKSLEVVNRKMDDNLI